MGEQKPKCAIADYGVIGNELTAALVSRSGSIDWFCAPNFDSEPSLCKLLDYGEGGSCEIQVADLESSSRRYLGQSNILETRFQSSSGVLLVQDFMPWHTAGDRSADGHYAGSSSVVRIFKCEQGSVSFKVSIRFTIGFELKKPAIRRMGAAEVFAVCAGDQGMRVYATQGTLEVRGEHITMCSHLQAGEETALVLEYAAHAPEQGSAPGNVSEWFLRTREFWEQWSAKCRYRGEYKDAVLRSALALKLLVFEPTGALLAAATTSLPEALGGPLNWDYRFVWLRDSSFTLRALLGLGYHEEANRFFRFLHDSVPQSGIRTLYTLYGAVPADEYEVKKLNGFCGSRPVRVGNEASGQLQLDIFGELVDCIDLFLRHEEMHDGEEETLWSLTEKAAEAVCRLWRQPDESIWETRLGARQFVHSKVMCWVALDRALRIGKHCKAHANFEQWRSVREEIHRSIEEEGFDSQLGAYTQAYNAKDLDASVLRLPLLRFIESGHARMRSTMQAIEKTLMKNR
ncbi:MAG TPA: glycoside hydrolase family 15 protein, partial [Terriglobales bacterium]